MAKPQTYPLLDSWALLNEKLGECSLKEVVGMLRAEAARKARRPDFLRRLLGRYRRLRRAPEEIELAAGKLPWDFKP